MTDTAQQRSGAADFDGGTARPLMRRGAETMDKKRMVEALWTGKTQRLSEVDLLKAIQIWIRSNRFTLEQIEKHRRVRNLVAHFVVRRFPDDDACLRCARPALVAGAS